MDLMPPVLGDVLLDFVWDRERLWSLDLPETSVPMAELDWHLQLPMWAFQGRPFILTPEQVARDPRAFSVQYARTATADLSYPLHVLERPSRLTVLDGTHRLLQALLKGHARVVVKRLPMGRLDDIVWSQSLSNAP
jgi:hypothetical protein